jgi:hypothetical protein
MTGLNRTGRGVGRDGTQRLAGRSGQHGWRQFGEPLASIPYRFRRWGDSIERGKMENNGPR